MNIVITITGVKLTPSWETLQRAIREATKDEQALLNRINRRDRGCDYRGLGSYDLGLILNGEQVTAELHVS